MRVAFLALALAAVALLAGAVLAQQVQLPGTETSPPSATRSPDRPVAADTSVLRAGTWQVAQGSWIGYAIGETSILGTNTVSGRTTDVSGRGRVGSTSGGFTLSGATFTANLTTLSSGDPFGDQQVQNALGTAQYPNAQFVQSAAVALPAMATLRNGVSVSIPGKISLRGVSHDVAIQTRATFSNGQLRLVGSIPVRLSGFGVDASALGGLVTLSDAAALNLSVILEPQ